MSDVDVREMQRGLGSDDRPVTRVLWERDASPKNAAMLDSGNFEPSNVHVDYKRYYDPAFMALEQEKLWAKSWLFACREEDLPEVGDRLPLQVGAQSYFIVRTGENTFKAFYNACMHRGMELCRDRSSSDNIRCPYHGWEWKLDGSIRFIPSHWDFRHVNRKNGSLREVKLDRWGGFIFINADPDAAPLEEALSVLPRHLEGFSFEKRYTAARFRRLIHCNWKLAQEAFHESYHVYGTHPEAVPYNGDSQAQYDIWESENGHIGRQITPSAVPSMHAAPDATDYDAALAFAQNMIAWHYPDASMPALDRGGDMRAQLADWHRRVQADAFGGPINQPDAVMLDSTLYFMFPNFTVWMSESLPFTYQFLPHESDPGQCYFEVRILHPHHLDTPIPPSAPTIELGPDDSIYEKAPSFGFMGYVFDQDMANLPYVQRGVRSADPRYHHAQLGRYQEMLIQHWNALVDRSLAR